MEQEQEEEEQEEQEEEQEQEQEEEQEEEGGMQKGEKKKRKKERKKRKEKDKAEHVPLCQGEIAQAFQGLCRSGQQVPRCQTRHQEEWKEQHPPEIS